MSNTALVGKSGCAEKRIRAMIGPEACWVMDRRRSLAALALAMTAACVGGVNRADCAIDSDCGANGFCFAGSCIAGTRTCPVLQPTFSSLNRGLIQPGCGSTGFGCGWPPATSIGASS